MRFKPFSEIISVQKGMRWPKFSIPQWREAGSSVIQQNWTLQVPFLGKYRQDNPKELLINSNFKRQSSIITADRFYLLKVANCPLTVMSINRGKRSNCALTSGTTFAEDFPLPRDSFAEP